MDYSQAIIKELRKEYPALESSGKYEINEGQHSEDEHINIVHLKLTGITNSSGECVTTHFVHDIRDKKFCVQSVVSDMFNALKWFLREHPEFATMEEWEPRRQEILADELPKRKALGLI